MRKVYEMETKFGADIYLVIRRHGRIQTYVSESGNLWPPSEEYLVRRRFHLSSHAD